MRRDKDAYMRFGGMPGIADIGLDQKKALVLLEGILKKIVTSSMTSSDLILKERNSYVLLKSITSLTSDLETICLDSGTVIDVSISKVDNSEVDFIAIKVDDKLYVQVTESMTSEDVRKRELAPLQKISDNYEKIILSLNTGMDSS